MIFSSLGSLADHLSARPGLTVVDPGVPLLDVATHGAAEVWRSQPSVRKVVSFAARNLASIPLNLYERVADDDRPRVRDHPLAAALGAPAPRVSPYRFWHAVWIDELIYDRWAILKVPTQDGGLNLVRLPARRTWFESDGLQRVTQINVMLGDGRKQEFEPEQVIHDSGYSTYGANGTSPMETLREILAESAEAVAYRRSVWKNQARVPTVIERPADAPSWGGPGGARERFIADWNAFTRGGGREGGTPILEDGMSLSKVDAFSPQDAGDLAGRQLSDIEVCSAYHIAPELTGARPGNYSNLESFRQSLYRDALGPWITSRDEVLNSQLTPDLAGDRPLYIEANVDVKLRGSFEEQARVLQASVGAPWLLRNEARARANLPAVDGGSELVTPLNVIVGGLASPRDTAPKSSAAAGGRGPHVKADPPDDLADPDRELEVFGDELAAFFDRQSRSVTSKLGAGKAGRKDDGPGDLADAWDADRWNTELAAIIGPRITRLAIAGAWQVLAQYNPEAEGWDADVMLAWLLAAADSHAEEINLSTHQALADAVIAGESWKDEVRGAFLHLAVNALPFATSMRTEALGFGGHDAAGASGLTHKTWETRSTDPRQQHQALNGETVLMSAEFSNGARWPGDSSLPVGERANCRCIVKFHVEGE